MIVHLQLFTMAAARIPKSQDDIIAELTAAASNPPNQQEIADIRTVLHEWLTYGESTHSCSLVESQTYHRLSFIYNKSIVVNDIITDLISQFADIRIIFDVQCGKTVAIIFKAKLNDFLSKPMDEYHDGRNTIRRLVRKILNEEKVNDVDRITTRICDKMDAAITTLDFLYDTLSKVNTTCELVKKLADRNSNVSY